MVPGPADHLQVVRLRMDLSKKEAAFPPRHSVVGDFRMSLSVSLPPCPLQWHALSREEQAKYYELARKERQLHMQLYPGWSARDNYVGGSFFSGLVCRRVPDVLGDKGNVSFVPSALCGDR